MAYKGKYAYWGIEGTVGSGEPGSDQNIPLNPMASMAAPKPKYVDVVERTFDQLEPKIIYTGELAPGEGPLPMSFRDPFMLLAFFTNKTIGGSWGTGTGTITADFTSTADQDTIWLQYQLEDLVASADINKLLKNGRPMKYSWIVETGKLLQEIPEFKFLNFATNIEAPTIANTFHDQSFGSAVGGWGDWDDSGCNGTGKRSPANMVIHWGAAVLTALKITTMTLEFTVGTETIQTIDALGHSVAYLSVRDFQLTLNGILTDLTAITEFEKLYCNRTTATLQVYYDHTTNEEKYLQFTNAYISPESEIASIPESGKVAETTLIIKGGEDCAASFSGKFVDLPDPSAFITAS